MSIIQKNAAKNFNKQTRIFSIQHKPRCIFPLKARQVVRVRDASDVSASPPLGLPRVGPCLRSVCRFMELLMQKLDNFSTAQQSVVKSLLFFFIIIIHEIALFSGEKNILQVIYDA